MGSKAGMPKTNHRALSGTGLRTTNQRALILEIIRRGKGHLDADEVYRRAREKQPRLVKRMVEIIEIIKLGKEAQGFTPAQTLGIESVWCFR